MYVSFRFFFYSGGGPIVGKKDPLPTASPWGGHGRQAGSHEGAAKPLRKTLRDTNTHPDDAPGSTFHARVLFEVFVCVFYFLPLPLAFAPCALCG